MYHIELKKNLSLNGVYMTVKKKACPSVESFIDKGAGVREIKEKKSFKNVLIRIPTCVLEELDYCISKKTWLNRTQWIVEAIHNKIKSDFCNEEK